MLTSLSESRNSDASWFVALDFCFSRISSTALLTMALFSYCQLNVPGYGDVPVILSRHNFSVHDSKVTQDITFFWRMTGAVEETNFWFAHYAIHIYFSTLASALTLLGVIPRRGGFSSIYPTVNSMFGIFLGRFFIGRFCFSPSVKSSDGANPGRRIKIGSCDVTRRRT